MTPASYPTSAPTAKKTIKLMMSMLPPIHFLRKSYMPTTKLTAPAM
jgi:hypothetical protein